MVNQLKVAILLLLLIFIVNYLLKKRENFSDKDTDTHIVIASCGDEKNVEKIKQLATSKANCKFFVYNKCGNIKNAIQL